MIGSTEPFASLPMYDLVPIRAATDRFWLLIRAAIEEHGEKSNLPAVKLTRTADVWSHWTSPSLFLSQTCGYPYVKHLSERVVLVGTPDYGIVADQPGRYVSNIIVHRDDHRTALEEFEGARFAYNSLDSQSGLHALMHTVLETVGDHVLFGSCNHTGEHAASLAAVAQGRADIASIDAVTWKLLKQHDQLADHVRILTTTPATPGLPFITALDNDAALIADAMENAIRCLSDADRSALGLQGFWRSQPSDYELIADRARRSNTLCKAHGLLPDQTSPA